MTLRRTDEAAVDLTGCRILVVDDNDDAKTLLRHVLTAASARVVDVSSADAALEALDEFAPHLLISDLAMPHLNGFDLIERVRTMGWTAERLPAIALSALAGDDDRFRALNAGFQAHVGKPPDVNRLIGQIALMLRLKR